MRVFGLIGKNIDYSFSKIFFDRKFQKESIIDCKYEIFDIKNQNEIKTLINENKNIKGLNITIPYKTTIINILDIISEEAQNIGAVNTIKISNKKLLGYNTDVIGFEQTFIKNKTAKHTSALILGSGGASKAVSFVLTKYNIKHKFVSRTTRTKKCLLYEDINKKIIKEYNIIINCTPLGTYPNIINIPNIPYKYLSSNHFLYDLVYNPSKTLFLKMGENKGACIKNGLEMLYLQAEASWKIWNNDLI